MRDTFIIFILLAIGTGSFGQPFKLDSTFNFPNGYVHTPVGGLMQDFGKTIAITSSNDYYIGGFGYASNYLEDGMIIKVSNTGSLVTSFGNNGKKIINLTPYREVVTDIILDAQDNIYAIHLTRDSVSTSYSRPSLIRLLPNGNFDLTFGTNGIVNIPNILTPYTEDYYGLGIDGTGRIVVAASDYYPDPYNPDIRVFRYLPTGFPDTSFGINGTATVSIANSQTVVGLVTQEEGKIWVYADTYSSQSLTDIVIVKFDPNGILSSSFGNNGIALHTFTNNNDRVTDLEIQPDGKLVISGMTIPNLTGGNVDILAARFNINGSRDSSFAINGLFTYSSLPNGGSESGKCMIIQSDGKILINGYITTASQACDLIFARLTTAGQPDPTFGSGGILIKHIALQTIGNDMMDQNNGKVVIGGTICFNLNYAYPVIFRFINDLSTSAYNPALNNDSPLAYPTVFSDNLTFTDDIDRVSNPVLELYNMLGECVLLLPVSNNPKPYLHQLPPAPYLLVLRSGNTLINKQMIFKAIR